MEKPSETSKANCPTATDDVDQKSEDEIQDLIKTLPQEKDWNEKSLCLYNGFWTPTYAIRGILSFRRNFHAHDTDIILATLPKSGTTWLLALAFSIVNRNKYSVYSKTHPLLTTNPHGLLASLEFHVYREGNPNSKLERIPSPRIYYTHIPYKGLPRSILYSKCKIVHICRNPLDHFTSHRHFMLKNQQELLPLDEAFDLFCQGVFSFGPFWDHVLGYWKVSKENPEKVLFLKYEDLKEDINSHVKKLAEFLGFPFSEEEEKQGSVEEISRLCSLENLRNLGVNQKGKLIHGAQSDSYFRKGEVGDWVNLLSPSMAQRMKKILNEKINGSGLNFEISSDTCGSSTSSLLD